jgi:hypothetical protein
VSVTSDAIIQKAEALMDFRRLEEARDLVNRAIASEPDVDTLWSTLANIEKRREDYKAAIVAGERALSIEPGNSIAMHVLVAAYEARRKTEKARAMADEIVHRYPEWVDGLIQRAYIYSRWYGKVTPAADSVAKVQASLDRAVELAPENPTTLAFAAVYYGAIWRADLGRPLMARALELAPTNELILQLSKDYADEQGQIDRDLAILADNPLSVSARASFDEKLWSRASSLAYTPLWTAGVVLLICHLFYDADGPWVRIVIGVGTVIAVLTIVGIIRRTRALFPAEILRSVIEYNRLVLPALIITAATTTVILVTVLVLTFAPVERADQFFRNAISTLSLATFVQALAAAAITFTTARVDIGSMKFADSPAGKVALKRQSENVGGAILGLFGGVVVIVLAVFSVERTSIFAVAALAVLCVCWTFSDFGANAYRRSQAYPTLWLAILLYLISFVVYVLAGMLTFDQLFASLD